MKLINIKFEMIKTNINRGLETNRPIGNDLWLKAWLGIRCEIDININTIETNIYLNIIV